MMLKNLKSNKKLFVGLLVGLCLSVGIGVIGAAAPNAWNIGDGWLWFANNSQGDVAANVDMPVDETNIANRSYVDGQVSAAGGTGEVSCTSACQGDVNGAANDHCFGACCALNAAGDDLICREWGNMDVTEPDPDPEPTAEYHFFLLSQGTYNGDLSGLSGANYKCLNEVNSYDFKNKPAFVFDQSEVKAFLCDTTDCNNLLGDSTIYQFGRIGDSGVGGDTFTTVDYAGVGLGPENSDDWSDNAHFGVNGYWWSNRADYISSETRFSAYRQSGSSYTTCNGWNTSTTYSMGAALLGQTEATDSDRWGGGNDYCNELNYLICIVDKVVY